jgi:N12 class adenine-specific DNA methylase
MIVLASYIGAGNFMTLSQSIMIIRILEDINHPLRALPNFMFELSKT